MADVAGGDILEGGLVRWLEHSLACSGRSLLIPSSAVQAVVVSNHLRRQAAACLESWRAELAGAGDDVASGAG